MGDIKPDIEKIQSQLDQLIIDSADSMEGLQDRGWASIEIWAAVANELLAEIDREPVSEEQRDQLGILLHAAIFRHAEALVQMRKEQRQAQSSLTELFDGNRRAGGASV